MYLLNKYFKNTFFRATQENNSSIISVDDIPGLEKFQKKPGIKETNKENGKNECNKKEEFTKPKQTKEVSYIYYYYIHI